MTKLGAQHSWDSWAIYKWIFVFPKKQRVPPNVLITKFLTQRILKVSLLSKYKYKKYILFIIVHIIVKITHKIHWRWKEKFWESSLCELPSIYILMIDRRLKSFKKKLQLSKKYQQTSNNVTLPSHTLVNVMDASSPRKRLSTIRTDAHAHARAGKRRLFPDSTGRCVVVRKK